MWLLLVVVDALELNLSSVFPEPVLKVRIAECPSALPCEASSAVAWFEGAAAPRAWTTARTGGFVVSYEVSFPDYSGGRAAHLAYVRVEYSSVRAALRSQDEASRSEASYVGAKIEGAWPLGVVPGQGRKPRGCEGRWVRTEGRRLLACEGDGPQDWRWDAPKCAQKRVDRRDDARKCLRSRGGLTLMGDSVLRQVAERLDCGLRAVGVLDATYPDDGYDDALLRYWRVKGPVPRRLGAVEALLAGHAANVSKRVIRGGGVLVLNLAGLWQAAYGDVDAYERSLDRVLRRLDTFDAVLLWLTTAVHPVHFLAEYDALYDAPTLAGPARQRKKRRRRRRRKLVGVDPDDRKRRRAQRFLEAGDSALSRLRKDAQVKRAMTQPRVEALADIERKAAKAHNLPFFDSLGITEVREDDPYDSTDMRHYGASTVAELADLLIAVVCAMPERRKWRRGHVAAAPGLAPAAHIDAIF